MAETEKKHLGIVEALFVDDVSAFLQERGESAPAALRWLNEQHQKYKLMEQGLMQKRRRLRGQMPDIEHSLKIIHYMQQKQKDGDKNIESHFMLSDNVFASASLSLTNSVCLWLGANVMMEYSVDAAIQLLEKNLTQARSSLNSLDSHLGFLRDQITTTEVTIARVYNWDVKRRQATTRT
uniref:Prefoldin subunit 3 n=1 Tax=Eptatretus burgeri TaxID=7764 RepID=A0A8C4QH16_EPTBU